MAVPPKEESIKRWIRRHEASPTSPDVVVIVVVMGGGTLEDKIIKVRCIHIYLPSDVCVAETR